MERERRGGGETFSRCTNFSSTPRAFSIFVKLSSRNQIRFELNLFPPFMDRRTLSLISSAFENNEATRMEKREA